MIIVPRPPTWYRDGLEGVSLVVDSVIIDCELEVSLSFNVNGRSSFRIYIRTEHGPLNKFKLLVHNVFRVLVNH